MENVKIRPLSDNDLDAIVRIDKSIFGTERRRYWKRKIAFSDIYPRPAFVAEVDGKVVGFILGFVSGWEFCIPNSVGWIDTIGVDPAYQRRGIGKILFKELVEVFKVSGQEKKGEKDRNKSKVEGVNIIHTLVSWDRWDLIQFYHAVGFKKGNMLNLEQKIR
ncbi:GNAT family N-acetyltransferase [Thermoproteota archaeon]